VQQLYYYCSVSCLPAFKAPGEQITWLLQLKQPIPYQSQVNQTQQELSLDTVVFDVFVW
jgi:hypothetical protein